MKDRRNNLLVTGALLVASLAACGESNTTDLRGESTRPTPIGNTTPESTIVITAVSILPTTSQAIPTPPPTKIVEPTHDGVEIQLPPEATSTPSSIEWDSLNLIDPINVETHNDLILKWSELRGIPPEIIAVIIDTESHGRKDPPWNMHIDPESGEVTGAGLMGITPYHPEKFPNRPSLEALIEDDDLNVETGTSILRTVYDDPSQGNGNWFLTFAHYNAGNDPQNGLSYATFMYHKLGWLEDADRQGEITDVFDMFEDEFPWTIEDAINLRDELNNQSD